MHFRADESLCRGTQLWNQVRFWSSSPPNMSEWHIREFIHIYLTDSLLSYIFVTLLQLCAWLSDNEGRFKPRIMDGDCSGTATNKETLRAYVQSEINTYLRVPASTGTSEVTWRKWKCMILFVDTIFYILLFRVGLSQLSCPPPHSQVRQRGYLTPERLTSCPGPFCCVWTWRGVDLEQRLLTSWSHFCLRCWTPWAESAPVSTCLCVRVIRACSSCSDCFSSEDHQVVSVLERSKVCNNNTDSML